MIKKFPHLHDYLTAEDISQYLNISAKSWKGRETRGTTPSPLIINEATYYKWGDILDWIRQQSISKPHNARKKDELAVRNSKIIDKYYELVNEGKRIPKRRALLAASKIIALDFDMRTMAVYSVLYNHKVKKQNQVNQMNDLYFGSSANNKIIQLKLPAIESPPKNDLEKVGHTQKDINSGKQNLFLKIYNMINIAEKHKRAN